jgi:hypothetical protein
MADGVRRKCRCLRALLGEKQVGTKGWSRPVEQTDAPGRSLTLTTLAVPNIIAQDPWERRPGGRHRLGTVAGFRSEKVAGLISECMAGFVGIRNSALRERLASNNASAKATF